MRTIMTVIQFTPLIGILILEQILAVQIPGLKELGLESDAIILMSVIITAGCVLHIGVRQFFIKEWLNTYIGDNSNNFIHLMLILLSIFAVIITAYVSTSTSVLLIATGMNIFNILITVPRRKINHYTY